MTFNFLISKEKIGGYRMGFNYAKEKLLFDKEWKTLKEQYIKEGMSKEAIEDLYDFDWSWFKMRRRYESHVQRLPEEDFDEQSIGNRTDLFKKYTSLSTELDEYFSGRYAWVDTLSNVKLVGKIKKLSFKELELLTLIAIEGYSQREIARKMNCSQNSISKKIIKIKKILESF